MSRLQKAFTVLRVCHSPLRVRVISSHFSGCLVQVHRSQASSVLSMVNFNMRAITLRSADAIVTRNRRLCASSLCTLAILLSLRAEGGRAQTNKNEPQVRFLAFEDERGTLAKYADSELPGSKIATPDEWDKWIREQDRDVRSRIDRGVEDSISNLILFGTSFTKLPRLGGPEFAVAVTGKLSPAARMR